MKNQIKYRLRKSIQLFFLTLLSGIVLLSCNWFGIKNQKLKFNPEVNKVYHFSLTKYATKSWTYQSTPFKIYDTVFLNFSLKNIHKSDSSDTCQFTLHSFVWKGKSKVNYQRDSMHAKSINFVISDSGKVESMQDMNAIFQDIKNDSATGKYLSGVIPDQVSNSAITDMLTRIFSIIPTKKVKPQDTWITNVTLTTKHPINFSNFLVFKSHNGDTAAIEIKSNIFAELSPGSGFYIKGNGDGEAFINYQTGIPYSYKTQTEIVTTTDYYDVKDSEKFILIQMDK